MKKILLIIFLLSTQSVIGCKLLCSVALSQDLDKMTTESRNRLLSEKGKEVVMRYGPGFYRTIYTPIIERNIVHERQMEMDEYTLDNQSGRPYYAIEFLYDSRRESMLEKYAAKVFFWADTGIAFKIIFGNGWTYAKLDEPKSRNSEDYPVMPFEYNPPQEDSSAD